MKILVHGVMSEGQHTLQRTEALARAPGLTVVRSAVDTGRRPFAQRILARIAGKTRWPTDLWGENRQLLDMARRHRPDVVLVENRSIIRRRTLRQVREETGAALAYLCPDDSLARQNRIKWKRDAFPEWDLYFTTKSFNVEELRERGVRRPLLIGNIFSPELHRPLTPAEVGPEFEAYDVVFVGVYEQERALSLRRLQDAGLSVIVYGPDAGAIQGRWSSLAGSGIALRPPVWGEDYVRALHRGRIVLGFLRKSQRDLITQRSIEVPAMARPMLAEKTEEHDRHFADGLEYVGFTDEADMIAKAKALIADPARRKAIGAAGRRRCLDSRYDVDALARFMAEAFRGVRGGA